MTGAPYGPLSRAEMAFYVTRAVVGAGAPFGTGEFVAQVIVALAAEGTDATPDLACALDALFGQTSSGAFVVKEGSRLAAEDARKLSALSVGAALGDWLLARGGGSVEIVGDGLLVSGTGAVLRTDTVDVPALARAIAVRMSQGLAPRKSHNEITVDADAWTTIQKHFRRYLVPSTAASRTSGAGAGLNDTD